MILNKKHPLYEEDLNYILSTKGLENIKNKSFLITGSTGMIGLCLIDALMLYNDKGANITIYAIGRNKEKARERLGEYYGNPLFHFIEQDVRNPLPSSIIVDYIIPFASNTHPLAYSKYPIETIEINVKGTEYALRKAIECKATLLYPSTVEVYGDARGEDVFTEDYTGQLNLSNSRACYTESKRVSEALCQSYIAQKGANVKIARLSRVFGPTMLMSDTKASSQFIQKALEGKDIILKSEGNQFFSYTYVSDVVSALLFMLVYCEIGVSYNIANDKCNSRLKDFALTCAKVANKKVCYDLPTETERKGYSVASKAIMSTDKLKELGWLGKYSFEEAVKRTVLILKE